MILKTQRFSYIAHNFKIVHLNTFFKKTFFTFWLSFISFSKLEAQVFPNPIQNNLTITTGAETRKTDFRWSIAGNIKGESPNIFSELIFKPIQSSGFFINASYKIHKRFSIETEFNRLFTHNGSATDFDYSGNDRTYPNTQLYLKSNKGNITNASGQLDYYILDKASFHIKAGAGYIFSNELFYLLNDNEPNLHTSYTAKWNGPKFNLEAQWVSNWKIKLAGAINYNLMQYNANANWNLIEEFKHPVSFKQNANGSGWNYSANAVYQINKRIGLNIGWQYANWKTKYGIDKLFLKTGDVPETRFNGAFKKSNEWKLAASYTF